MQIEALTTQLRRKMKQKHRNIEITEIFKGRNIEADAERDDLNRVMTVFSKRNSINLLIFQTMIARL